MTSNSDIVRRFVDAWNRLDWDEAYGMLSSDVVCHNIPMEPLRGRDTVRSFYETLGETTWADWRIVNIAENGNVVLTERQDDFTMNGKNFSLPVMGTFEISDGKIAVWRDYFDMKDLERQMAG